MPAINRTKPRVPRGPTPSEFSFETIKKWVSTQLGYPFVDVELLDEELDPGFTVLHQAIEDAFEEYSRVVPYQDRVVLDVCSDIQEYILPYVGRGVVGVEYKTSALQYNISEPLTFNLGSGILFSSYPVLKDWNTGIDSMIENVLYQKTARKILGKDFWYKVSDDGKTLYVQNIPQGANQLVVLYDDDHDYTTLPSSDRMWIRKFTLAKCRQVLGEARAKYPVTGPAGQQMLQRTEDMRQQGIAEEQELLAKLQWLATPLPPTFDDHAY